MPEFYIITGSTLTNVTCETLVTLGMKNQTCCPNVLDKLWNLIRGQRQVTMAKRLRLIACVVQVGDHRDWGKGKLLEQIFISEAKFFGRGTDTQREWGVSLIAGTHIKGESFSLG